MSLLMALQSRRNTMRTTLHLVCGIAFTLLLACAANAQVVNIWPGAAPGSESWTQKERAVENTPLGTVVFNVVTPTLTVYLPEPNTAAIRGVRRHAPEWGVSPERVGFMGFSAGAMVASGALLNEDAAARPNFAALI